MLETHDTFSDKLRIRHLVLKGTMRTLCGVGVVGIAPDQKVKPVQQCRACARRLKEQLGLSH